MMKPDKGQGATMKLGDRMVHVKRGACTVSLFRRDYENLVYVIFDPKSPNGIAAGFWVLKADLSPEAAKR